MAAPLVDLSPPVLSSSLELLSADPVAVVEQALDAAPTAVEVLQAAATEISLTELGLAAHTPVGLVQHLLEFMHVDLGLPWWGAIVVGQQPILINQSFNSQAFCFLSFLILFFLFTGVKGRCWLVWLCFRS